MSPSVIGCPGVIFRPLAVLSHAAPSLEWIGCDDGGLENEEFCDAEDWSFR
jgi:hypothetical protein